MNPESNERVRQFLEESAAVITLTGQRLAERIAEAANVIIASLRDGGNLFVFGNGGSAADAQHIAGELVGRFRRDRQAFRAEALTTDASVLTAIANDFGFEAVFAHQLAGKGASGDVAVGLSTSGNSANVVAALTTARKMGLKTIAMTGADGGQCAALADVLLDAPSTDVPRIQEAHAVIYHALCELVEAAMTDEP